MSMKKNMSRRDVLAQGSTVAAAGALASVAIPAVHAQGGDAIKVSLVGCGGRGTGAATQALSTKLVLFTCMRWLTCSSRRSRAVMTRCSKMRKSKARYP